MPNFHVDGIAYACRLSLAPAPYTLLRMVSARRVVMDPEPDPGSATPVSTASAAAVTCVQTPVAARPGAASAAARSGGVR